MPDNIAGSLIGAGGSVAGGLIGGIFGNKAQRSANRTNLQIARETNAQNYQIFKEQQEYNEHMYNQWLDYNSPINQRARYEQAGINPYMAMSNIGSGSPQSALQSPQAPQMQGAQVQPVDALSNNMSSAIQQAAQVYATVSTAQAQNEKTKAETLLTLGNLGWLDKRNLAEISHLNSQTRNNDFDFSFRNQTLGNMLKLSDQSVSQGDAILKQTQAMTEGILIDNSVKQFHFDLDKKYSEPMMQQALAKAINENAYIRAQIAAVTYDTQVYKPGMLANDKQRVANDTQRTADSHVLTYSQCAQLAAATTKLYEEATGVRIDNKTKHQLNSVILQNYGQDVEHKRNENYTSTKARHAKENGSLAVESIDALGYIINGLLPLGNFLK